LALAALVGGPGLLAPQVVAAGADPIVVPREAESAGGGPAEPRDDAPPPAGAHGHGAQDLTDPGTMPTIQYLQAEEHAADKIDFQPGDQVSIPFTPGKSDHWQVDGQEPQGLPPGHANGHEMRSEAPDAVWAAGAPTDLAGLAQDSPIDEPSSDAGPAADGAPASTTTSSSATDPSSATAVGSTGLRREVFGFLPYWVIGGSTTIIDWRTLSTVAYFSVGCLQSGYLDKVNPDGSATTGWAGWTSSKMTSIITAAHQNHTRVVLTVSCFAWSSAGATRQARLLGSSTARANLARSVAAAVRDRGADGVNLDFEPIAAGYSNQFTALVRSIRAELNRVHAGYQLTFDAMGSIGNQPIADATAPGGADAVFVMGYDYRTASSSTAGSISPLTGPHYDLTDTVKAFTARISPSKVILGVPYYGRAWSTSSDAVDAPTLNPAKYGGSAVPTYAQAMDQVTLHGRRYDPVEQTPWSAYRKQTCTSAYGCVTAWRELYYDDAASLGLRYDLVNRSALRGAGIWAIGYDGARPELRAELAAKFLADKTAPLTGIVTLAQQQRDEGFRVSWAGSDDSAIAAYDVQVSVNGGAWTAWLTGTTQTSSIYPGADGRTYAFRDRAVDVHGNASAWRSLALGNLSAPARITVGGFATVLTDGLRMREAPATGASIMTTLSDGDALQVIGGPVSGEGYTWFEVSGPIRQWAPVDAPQIGGWVAVSGNGATNVAPRRPVYATVVNAGITGMLLANGGERVLTPNRDGSQDVLRVAWTNQVDFDSMALRIFRTDGTFVGAVGLGSTGAGSHAYSWNGQVGGVMVPNGYYVLQLQGMRGSTAYSSPSASPVSMSQIAAFGVIVTPRSPTSVVSFASLAPATKQSTMTWRLVFGGPIGGLSATDFARTGTATGCRTGTPVGAGSTWTVTLTGCSTGTVGLALKARAVFDTVRNWGPATAAHAPTLVIDRSAPRSTAPKVGITPGVTLPSAASTVGIWSRLTWAATDSGGAGIASYDLQRSVDGAAFSPYLSGTTTTALGVSLIPGHTYRFAVRARDRAGNVGAWVAGSTVRAYLPQDASAGLTWKGIWRTATGPQCSGGSLRFGMGGGASVTYAFTGRSIAWVAMLGPDRGVARVYVDGLLVSTVDLRSPIVVYRRVAFARSWSAAGAHSLRVVVAGTAGRPRVDIDAFELIR
jgi:spore germination protein YaaH